MKLHFEPDLEYQLQAIEATCDLFRGQEICKTEFTVIRGHADRQMLIGENETYLGVGNRLMLLPDEMERNLAAVQQRNGLRPTGKLTSTDFAIEMETGTGKTYVYLRTIFELNRRYGFTKFVIVVPSVAIKEGVYKTLQVTEEHFKAQFAGVPYEYFTYDSGKLGQVRNFATSPHIQIMVVTVGAINKRDVNNLYKESEKTGGERPIDLIKATHPIIIVDEPQSVDGGLQGNGKKALDAMNPLCTLRYSATHIDKHQMLYRLDAVDAYEQRLVKQIEVASATVEHAHNKPYVRLVEIQSKRNQISARVELDVENFVGVKRQVVTVEHGDNLEQITGRPLYADCRIGEIRAAKGNQYMELQVPGGEQFLKPGEAWGDVDHLAVQRQMIRRTIKEHLDKEKKLRRQGIKVLSLFFIDEVARYRQHDEHGNSIKGVYAQIFEEEYRRLANSLDYRNFLQEADLTHPAEAVHDGYFSIDRKGGWTNTDENNQTSRDNAERAYNLIMKEKERLLSFETPLKFIFSHSALREGWDNPNVFQICTLREIQTERERRQTIGRGLRLCVNQDGERVRGFDVNTLTVIATESYEQFAANLQKEIEQDTGIQFGILEEHHFALIPIAAAEDGSNEVLGLAQSKVLWEHLKSTGLIDRGGKVQESLKVTLRDGTLRLPPAFAPHHEQITHILKRLVGRRIEIKNADEKRTVKTRQTVLNSPEFKALWERIKHKTTYRVQFDNEKLIERCIQSLIEAPAIPKTRLQWRKAEIAIGKAGVEATEREGATTIVLDEGDIQLPDLLTELADRTQLTRRSLQRILSGCMRLNDFRRNPQAFIELAADAINRCKRMVIVTGIKYQRLGDGEYYAQELFETKELAGYLKNMMTVQKAVYEEVLYDSEVERNFADQLEKNEAIKVYAKLPGWFVVPTPLGGYNPDWAVLIEKDGAERLYFVVETKGGPFVDDLRDRERAKIKCGEAHFEALATGENPARYMMATNVDDLLNRD